MWPVWYCAVRDRRWLPPARTAFNYRPLAITEQGSREPSQMHRQPTVLWAGVLSFSLFILKCAFVAKVMTAG